MVNSQAPQSEMMIVRQAPYCETEVPPTKGAWYWIEILPYDDSSKNSGVLVNSTGTGAINPNNILALNTNMSTNYSACLWPQTYHHGCIAANICAPEAKD
jgi:hypothetical protein